MILTYDIHAAKREKPYKINFSKNFEFYPNQLPREEETWLKENSEAIEVFNERVTQHGVFSNGLRNF